MPRSSKLAGILVRSEGARGGALTASPESSTDNSLACSRDIVGVPVPSVWQAARIRNMVMAHGRTARAQEVELLEEQMPVLADACMAPPILSLPQMGSNVEEL